MRGAIMEAYLSAATVPAILTTADRSPEEMATVRSTATCAGACGAGFAYLYQANAPAAITTSANKIPHFPRCGLGPPGRGTIAGAGTWGAGATWVPSIGAGALLENDCIPSPSNPSWANYTPGYIFKKDALGSSKVSGVPAESSPFF